MAIKRTTAKAKPSATDDMVSRATASAKRAISEAADHKLAAAPPIGDNKPPADDSLQAFRDRLVDLRTAGDAWLKAGKVDSQEEADRLEAFRKQCRAAINDAEKQRKAEKKPHDDAAAAVQKKWLPVTDSFNRIIDAVTPILTAFAKAEQEKIAAERKRLADEAEAKRREAERAAERAMETGTLSAQDAAADAARDLEAAEEAAKQAASAKVAIGGETTVGGIKRSASLRSFEKIEVAAPIDALTALAASGQSLDGVKDAIAALFRAARKAHPEQFAACPGIVITTEERVV